MAIAMKEKKYFGLPTSSVSDPDPDLIRSLDPDPGARK